MYQYTEFDRQFVKLRAQQYRDQLERWQAGELSDDEFRPLRLQNGWYVQRYAPMLRVAVPYGEICPARSCACWPDRPRLRPSPTPELLARPRPRRPGSPARPPPCPLRLRPLHHAPERAVQLDPAHQGRRRDGPAGQREHARHPDQRQLHPQHHQRRARRHCRGRDRRPAPLCEIMRQWSTLHPEFAFLPRKFKIAINGATEDRAATGWHDVGLQALKNTQGRAGLQGAGGRRHGPHAGDCHRDPRVPALEPDPQLPRGGGARLQPLGPARQQVQGAHQDPGEGRGPALHRRSGGRVPPDRRAGRRPHTITQAELDRVQRLLRAGAAASCAPRNRPAHPARRKASSTSAGCSKTCTATRTPACAP
jgi:sulfite reductase (NADPH) hemoprotein beta-component